LPVTGYLKNTPHPKICQLAGIATPNICWEVACRLGKEQNIPNFRFRSRKSFLKTTKPLKNNLKRYEEKGGNTLFPRNTIKTSV